MPAPHQEPHQNATNEDTALNTGGLPTFSAARYRLLLNRDEPADNRLTISWDLACFGHSFQGPERTSLILKALSIEADPHVYLNLLVAVENTSKEIRKLIPFLIILLNSNFKDETYALLEKWVMSKTPAEACNALKKYLPLLWHMNFDGLTISRLLLTLDHKTYEKMERWRSDLEKYRHRTEIPRLSKRDRAALEVAGKDGPLPTAVKEKADKLLFLAMSSHNAKQPKAYQAICEMPYFQPVLTLYKLYQSTQGRAVEQVGALSEACFMLEANKHEHLAAVALRLANDAHALFINSEATTVFPAPPEVTAIYASCAAKLLGYVDEYLLPSLLLPFTPEAQEQFKLSELVPFNEQVEHVLSIPQQVIRRGGAEVVEKVTEILSSKAKALLPLRSFILQALHESNWPIDFLRPCLRHLILFDTPEIIEALNLFKNKAPQSATMWLEMTRYIGPLTTLRRKSIKEPATEVLGLLDSAGATLTVIRRDLLALVLLAKGFEGNEEALSNLREPKDFREDSEKWRSKHMLEIQSGLLKMIYTVGERMKIELRPKKENRDKRMIKKGIQFLENLKSEIEKASAETEQNILLKMVDDLYAEVKELNYSLMPAFFDTSKFEKPGEQKPLS